MERAHITTRNTSDTLCVGWVTQASMAVAKLAQKNVAMEEAHSNVRKTLMQYYSRLPTSEHPEVLKEMLNDSEHAWQSVMTHIADKSDPKRLKKLIARTIKTASGGDYDPQTVMHMVSVMMNETPKLGTSAASSTEHGTEESSVTSGVLMVLEMMKSLTPDERETILSMYFKTLDPEQRTEALQYVALVYLM